MYMLFLDESGYYRSDYPANYPESDFLIVGGVLVKEKDYMKCQKDFLEFKRSNFPKEVADLPIHAVDLNQVARNPKNTYKEFLTPEKARSLLNDTYKFIATLPLEAIAVLVDNVCLREKYTTPADPYLLAYEIIIEKYQIIISKRNEEENVFGIVNISHSSRPLAYKLTKIHEDMMKSGTDYVKFSTIFPKLNVQPTRDCCFFEIADMICYAYNRWYHTWLCDHMGKRAIDEGYLNCIENLCKNITIGTVVLDHKFHLKVIPYPRFLKS